MSYETADSQKKEFRKYLEQLGIAWQFFCLHQGSIIWIYETVGISDKVSLSLKELPCLCNMIVSKCVFKHVLRSVAKRVYSPSFHEVSCWNAETPTELTETDRNWQEEWDHLPADSCAGGTLRGARASGQCLRSQSASGRLVIHRLDDHGRIPNTKRRPPPILNTASSF